MTGAKGLLSLPLVTKKSKLKQLPLNIKLTFVFLPPSIALFLPKTLSAPPCPGPGAILQPTFCCSVGPCTHRAISSVCSVSLSSAEAPCAVHTAGCCCHLRRAGPAASRDGGDQHSRMGRPPARELTCCGNEQQN